MNITSVVYRCSALRASERPGEWCPHVAVAGRSNVGKSSLLNWMWKQTCAHVAKTPGKTRTLNFFLVNGSFYMVDLPGYGYARVQRELRQQWGRELGDYLAGEERLAGVMTLIDIRHGPTDLDLELQQMLSAMGRERLVVLTKADKVGRSHQAKMRRQVQLQLGEATPPAVVSVRTGAGRHELLERVGALLQGWRERQRGDDHGTQEAEQR